MANVHNIKKFIERRRKLRIDSTPAESVLWEELRANKLGSKFKRQHSIGGYILDFYCAEKRLIIELDGSVHNSKDQKEYDTIRDRYFAELEYKVLRFKNFEIERSLNRVLEKISAVLSL